ncbi:hypothetical protein Tco_0006012 [Tanacetum coccineum]
MFHHTLTISRRLTLICTKLCASETEKVDKSLRTYVETSDNKGADDRLETTMVTNNNPLRSELKSTWKGCQVFLAQISAKKEEDKSEGKQIKDEPHPTLGAPLLNWLHPNEGNYRNITSAFDKDSIRLVPHLGEPRSYNSKEWNSGDDQLRLRWMIYLVVLADAAESVRDTIGFEYCLASSSGWTKSPVLWAEIGESSLTGPELVLDTTDKVVLIKEKLKAARDRQKSYADKRRKPLEFEILERIGPVAYRLRLPEELSSVHDTFHVSNLKKCLADANLHVPLNEIKIDKTLRFVEELVEIMDREIRNLKRSKIPLVKVHWNSKRGPEFTWEREDHMKSKYPQLFVDRAVESAS